MELSNCCPATMRRTARLMPEYRVGCSSNPFLYLGEDGLMSSIFPLSTFSVKRMYICIYLVFIADLALVLGKNKHLLRTISNQIVYLFECYQRKVSMNKTPEEPLRNICASFHQPLYGIVSVLGVLAVRVEEDVLINPPAEAEHVGGRVLARLQHLEHHAQCLLAVPRTVPPARESTTQRERDNERGTTAPFT